MRFVAKPIAASISLVFGALTLAHTAVAADVLFTQVATSGAASSSTLWPDGSDWDTQVWDNFSFKRGASVSSVEWWGSSPAAVSEFALTVYTDISSIPYNQQQFGYTLASVLQPDIGAGPLRAITFAIADLNVSQVSASLWYFSANLGASPPLALDGHQSYWLGVQAHEAPTNSWGWSLASGDGRAFGKGGTFGAGDYRYYANRQDFAFQIDGTPVAVPEPATAGLLIGGLISTMLWSRRRFAESAKAQH